MQIAAPASSLAPSCAGGNAGPERILGVPAARLLSTCEVGHDFHFYQDGNRGFEFLGFLTPRLESFFPTTSEFLKIFHRSTLSQGEQTYYNLQKQKLRI